MNKMKHNTCNQHYTQILHDTVSTSSPLSVERLCTTVSKLGNFKSSLGIIKEHFHALVIAAFKLFYHRGSIILPKCSTIKTYAVGSKQSYFNLPGALAKDANQCIGSVVHITYFTMNVSIITERVSNNVA